MKFRKFLLAAMICAMCVGQASALEFTYDAPEDYLFGRPTSQDAPYVQENPNVDRSKNTALIQLVNVSKIAVCTSIMASDCDISRPNTGFREVSGPLCQGGAVSPFVNFYVNAKAGDF